MYTHIYVCVCVYVYVYEDTRTVKDETGHVGCARKYFKDLCEKRSLGDPIKVCRVAKIYMYKCICICIYIYVCVCVCVYIYA